MTGISVEDNHLLTGDLSKADETFAEDRLQFELHLLVDPDDHLSGQLELNKLDRASIEVALFLVGRPRDKSQIKIEVSDHLTSPVPRSSPSEVMQDQGRNSSRIMGKDLRIFFSNAQD